MSKKGYQRIHLLIADRKYPFDIPVKELKEKEVLYRDAAKEINSVIEYYRENYNEADIQDILSMSLLSTAIQLEEMKHNKDYSILVDEIDKIDTTLSDYLNKEGEKED